MGIVFTAKIGLNYRKLKKNEISKSEFWKRMRVNSVSTVGGLAVGTGGAAAGFFLGTLIIPGVGSIVGAVVGGLVGGIAGEKLSMKGMVVVEDKIE